MQGLQSSPISCYLYVFQCFTFSSKSIFSIKTTFGLILHTSTTFDCGGFELNLQIPKIPIEIFVGLYMLPLPVKAESGFSTIL